MPFYPFKFMQSTAVMIGKESYTNKWNQNDSVTIHVAKPVPQVIDEEVAKTGVNT